MHRHSVWEERGIPGKVEIPEVNQNVFPANPEHSVIVFPRFGSIVPELGAQLFVVPALKIVRRKSTSPTLETCEICIARKKLSPTSPCEPRDSSFATTDGRPVFV